jgi:hypothetical protein
MKKMVLFLAVILLFCAADAFAFTCQGNFISTGMREYEVLDRCGDPTHVETWQEYVYTNARPSPYPQDDAGAGIIVLPGTIIAVTYERWVYNFGSKKLMPVLTFRNNKLIKIERGGYGY